MRSSSRNKRRAAIYRRLTRRAGIFVCVLYTRRVRLLLYWRHVIVCDRCGISCCWLALKKRIHSCYNELLSAAVADREQYNQFERRHFNVKPVLFNIAICTLYLAGSRKLERHPYLRTLYHQEGWFIQAPPSIHWLNHQCHLQLGKCNILI